MPIYEAEIDIIVRGHGTVKVEADSVEEAIEIIEEDPDYYMEQCWEEFMSINDPEFDGVSNLVCISGNNRSEKNHLLHEDADMNDEEEE